MSVCDMRQKMDYQIIYKRKIMVNYRNKLEGSLYNNSKFTTKNFYQFTDCITLTLPSSDFIHEYLALKYFNIFLSSLNFA